MLAKSALPLAVAHNCCKVLNSFGFRSLLKTDHHASYYVNEISCGCSGLSMTLFGCLSSWHPCIGRRFSLFTGQGRSDGGLLKKVYCFCSHFTLLLSS